MLRSLRQADDPTPVVMISGHGTIRDAVEATRSGAFDFLEKPLARDRVLLVVKNALERSDLQRENQRFRELVGDAPRMIGRSAAFQHAVQRGDAGGAIGRRRAAAPASRARARSCWRRTFIARARSRRARS